MPSAETRRRVETNIKPVDVQFSDFGISLFESHHGPEFAMDMSRYPFHKIALILDGRGWIESKLGQRALEARSFLFLPMNEEHRFIDQRSEPLSLIVVCFQPETFSHHPEAKKVLDGVCKNIPALLPHEFNDAFRHNGVLNSLKLMIFEQSNEKPGYASMIWSELLQLLVFLTRSFDEITSNKNGNSNTEGFEASVAYLEQNFNKGIQVGDLADIAKVSYRHYTDTFKRQTGKTVNQYLTELKIGFAKKRLQESRNVLYSSLESGFEDLAHFYRVFKRETGITPKQFLKQVG